MPETGSYLPSEVMNINPAGNLSVTLVLTAASGPLLVTVIVQVITSPVLTDFLETSLTITKSALGPTSVVLLASLLVLLESGVSLVTLATFNIVVLVIFTIVVITKLADLPLAKSPTIQRPVIGS